MATTTISQEYRAFIRTLRGILLYPGLWPVVKPNLFYRFLPTFMLITCVIQSLAILNFVRVHHSSIPIMTRGMSSAVTFITVALKLLYFNPNRKCVKVLHETLDRMTKELFNDIAMKNLVSKKFIAVRRLLNIYIYFVFSSVFAYMILPIVIVIYQYAHQIHPIKYPLPTPAVYPWVIPGASALYFCHYTFDIICFLNSFCLTTGIDSFFGICIFLMSMKLRAMSYRLNTPKVDADYDSIVHECITNYEMLLRCRNNIQRIYGPTILWILLTSAIVLCVNVYQISKIQTFSFARIAFFAVYMCARMLMTFIYTWFGSMLTTESEKFTQAVYASDWPVTGQRRFMSSILIMLTQKPLVITACSCVTITVDMFTKVLNTAISYFFLLRTMEGKGT